MRTILQFSIATSFVGVAALTIHCSNSDAGPLVGEPDGGALVDAADPIPPEPGACSKHCSDDLSSVLDCRGAVLETCTGSKGCADGTCVPACDSSKANRSNNGCEFVVPRSPTLDPSSCHAIFVTNGWRTAATLKVTYKAEAMPLDGHAVRAADRTPVLGSAVAPGETVIVALAGKSCPFAPFVADRYYYARDVGLTESGRTQAFIVESDVPVQMHDIDVLTPTSDDPVSKGAALLAASSAWGTDYVVGMPTPEEAHGGFIEIVGREDSVVELRPREEVLGSPDLPSVARNEIRSYRLGRGEVLQFVQDGDLTGSFIRANKPVGVFAGALDFMAEGTNWEAAHAQLTPVRSMGDRYAGVRYRDRYEDRVEKAVWRVVGAVDGTTFTYEPATPPGAPTKLDAGQFAEFETSTPFVVSSQDAEHSFAVYAFMTSSTKYRSDLNLPWWEGDLRGDPEFIPVIPIVQYQKSYRFYTDPFFPETNVVVVRRRGPAGFADVVLDCAGTLEGWAGVGPIGDIEFTRVDLSKGNYEPQGNCKNGVHEMHSDAPFTATVWGWGSKVTGGGALPGPWTRMVSYAFPVGAGFRPVNTIELPGGVQ